MPEDTVEQDATLEHDIQGKANRIFELGKKLAELNPSSEDDLTSFIVTYPEKPGDLQRDFPVGKGIFVKMYESSHDSSNGRVKDSTSLEFGIKLNSLELQELGKKRSVANDRGGTKLVIIKSTDYPDDLDVYLSSPATMYGAAPILGIEDYKLGRGLLDKIEAQLKETPTSTENMLPR